MLRVKQRLAEVIILTKIMKVRQDENREITDIMLDDGRSLTLEEAVQEAQEGKIEGVNVVSKSGKRYLRANPDNNVGNNLDKLPQF
ncbi:MAG: DUF3892 domain-containing protein [Desulfitobacteriaceae bacterium]|nr:DUF3892 domain-containing protein [Desulfitobacteriaceae bacterium]MDD4752310.1 DUF3892 domain-containing protein [Desulfitobacteriaceae bacterium]